jgi:hypothetical protein
VYCHPLEEGWPRDAEVLETVPVRSCARRGRAVDLVLDRGQRNRSQFVFTEPHAGRRGGRPMIFWQTARTAGRARPGQRVPSARTAGDQLATSWRSRSTRASATRTSTTAARCARSGQALSAGD